MKKTLTLIALSAALSASAQVTSLSATVGASYDSVAGGSGFRAGSAIGLVAVTPVGVFDGSVTGQTNRFGAEDDVLGFDVGYSNGLKLTSGTLTGRVGYGRRNQVNVGDNVEFYSLGAEFAAPVAKNVGVFVGYRHRNTTRTDVSNFAENRWAAGADYQLNSKIGIRAGLSRTTVGGTKMNGALAAVTYKF